MVLEVIVDLTTSQVDKIFDYIADVEVQVGQKVLVPFGSRNIYGYVVGKKQQSSYQDKLKSIVKVCNEPALFNQSTLDFAFQISQRYHVSKAMALRLFLPSEMRKDKVHDKFENFIYPSSLTLDEAIVSLRNKSNTQIEVLERVYTLERVSMSKLCSEFSRSVVNTLIKKELLLVKSEQVNRSPVKRFIEEDKPKKLTQEQKNAFDSILKTDKKVSLIYGVTGSGKTEIYMQLVERYLKEGKTAIILVPEICLTPQIVERFKSRFGELSAVLHSRLSVGEKHDEWWRIKRGEAKIVIGARSAIFSPVENLGIIIIDEEHDGSYNNESGVRYKTIEIAKMRASFSDTKILLGSATPSFESYYFAKNREYNLCYLKNRINNQPMPEVEIVDMRKELKRGNFSSLSNSLINELETCFSNGEQAIIFINRRGYSQHLICRDCGYVAKCESCDVSLNYHETECCLKCHYCGKKYYTLSACPECGGIHFKNGGYGVQKVEKDLLKVFPNAKVLRMDYDTTSGKDGHYNILNDFKNKKADILLGTQMVAKGHDFENVTLVGIIDADLLLYGANYDSAERAFQIITQVGGRCGRGEKDGKIILQTTSPDNYTFKYASYYDFKNFYEQEIMIREMTHFPPFAKVVRVLISGEDEERTIESFKSIYYELETLQTKYKEEVLFFQKMCCPIKKIQNKFRYQVLFRLKKDTDILDLIYSKSLKYNSQNTRVVVEENPTDLR